MHLRDGTLVARQALAVMPRFVARSEVLAGLGLHSTHPFGTGEFIAADPRGLTEVSGVWVAANITGITAQVVSSAAGGVVAAAAINADCHPRRNTVALPRSGRISR